MLHFRAQEDKVE